MHRRFLFGALVAAIVLVLSAEAAGAHASFVGVPSGVPTNSDVTLTMNVPHERDDTTYNVDVLIAMPTGWTASSCQGKATWTCSLGTVDGRQTVRFTKAAGAAVAEDETFVFVARSAPTVGSFAFPTVQTYNTTEVVRWIGAAGTSNPAPALNTFASNTPPPPPSPPTTNPDAPPPTQATTIPTTAPPVTTTATTAPTTTTSASTTATASSTATSTTSRPEASISSVTTGPSSATDAERNDDGGVRGLAVVALVVLAAAVGGTGAWAWRRQSQSRLRNNA